MPLEISKEIEELKKKLQKLAKVEIGLSNYRDVMRQYQQLLYDLMTKMQKLCEATDKALNPPLLKGPESKKET